MLLKNGLCVLENMLSRHLFLKLDKIALLFVSIRILAFSPRDLERRQK